MRADLSFRFGFQASRRECARKRRRIAFTQLLLTLALALSTVIALTAVSIGMARAATLGTIMANDNGSIGVALLLAAVLGAMGAFTALATHLFDTHTPH